VERESALVPWKKVTVQGLITRTYLDPNRSVSDKTLGHSMTTKQQYTALADLRVGMPAAELERILGDDWRMPGKAEKGYFYVSGPMLQLGPSYPVQVRVTTDGTIGALSFY
jgi:hypothetical protein